MSYTKKLIIIIVMVCSSPIIADSQNTVDVAEIIHANRLDKAEKGLFCNARNQILELKQWTCEHVPDTIYAIESWSLEMGTFTLMYWNQEKIVSVLQDYMGDSLVAYNRRAFTKRIIALVEEWDPEKIINHIGRVNPPNKLYATRIILNEQKSVIVDTLCFQDFFLIDDFDDAIELDEIWHPQQKVKEEERRYPCSIGEPGN